MKSVGRPLVFSIVYCAVSTFVGALLSAQFAQLPNAVVSFGGGVATCAVGDIVGGSHPDIVSALGSPPSIVIAENSAGGSFNLGASLPLPAAPIDLSIADLDGDGDNDFVCLTTTQASVFLRSGTAFGRTDYPIANSASSTVVLSDLDGDGDVDIFRGSVCIANVGNGTFGAPTTLITVGGAPIDATIGDFDGDGDADLVSRVLSGSNYSISLFANLGSGMWANSWTTTIANVANSNNVSIAPWAAEAADMNNDGIDDLVVTYVEQGIAKSRARTFLGQTNGSLVDLLPTFFGEGFSAVSIPAMAIADFDGDGFRDAATFIAGWYSDHPSSTVLLTRNDRSGRAILPNSNGSVLTVTKRCADLDLDGDVDGVAQFGPSALAIHLNDGSLAPIAGIPSLAIVTGQNQSTIQPFPFSSPLSVALVDGNGSPLADVPIEFRVVTGSAELTGWIFFGSCIYPRTSIAGNASVGVWPQFVPGPVTIEASISPTVKTVFSLNVIGAVQVISIVSGDQQTTARGTTFGAPLVVEVRNSVTGAVMPNFPLAFTASAGVTITNGTSPNWHSAYTDFQGRASITVAGQLVNVTQTATVTVEAFDYPYPSAAATFQLVVLGLPMVEAASPIVQVIDAQDSTDPISVRVVDEYGQPIVGLAVNFTTNPPGKLVFSTANPVVTDAQGVATVVATPTPSAGGAIYVLAQTPGLLLGASVGMQVFVRKLDVVISSANNAAVMIYRHQSGPQPFVLMVDTPLPAPGTVPTPYGNLATSLLAPSPVLLVADVFGAFGVSDPGLVASPTFTRSYAIAPGLGGVTFVVQVLGFDPAFASEPEKAIFLSNAVTVTL